MTPMSPTLMIPTGAVMLAVAAASGLYTARLALYGTAAAPPTLDRCNRALAGIGFALLVFATFLHGGLPVMQAATLLLLLMAGIAGAWLNLRLHVRESRLSLTPVLVHGLVALAGLSTLLKVLLRFNE